MNLKIILSRFVRQELKKHKEDANNRWNFDFEAGRPLKGRLDWEQVPSQQLHPVGGCCACFKIERFCKFGDWVWTLLLLVLIR